jgi:hypothetical protein
MTTVDKGVEEEIAKSFPKIYLSQWLYKLSMLPPEDKMAIQLKEQLLEEIKKHSIYDIIHCSYIDMSPYYQHVCSTLKCTVDEQLLAQLNEGVKQKLDEIEKTMKEAKEV